MKRHLRHHLETQLMTKKTVTISHYQEKLQWQVTETDGPFYNETGIDNTTVEKQPIPPNDDIFNSFYEETPINVNPVIFTKELSQAVVDKLPTPNEHLLMTGLLSNESL